MQNLGFICELYITLILRNCLVFLSEHTLCLAWVTDDPMGPGLF